MKGKLLALASAFLAGCSNAPSSGAIEEALEAIVGPCQNVEVADIEKTNGYQEDGYYRVEYKFALEVKEKSKLKELNETWRAEYRQFQESQKLYREVEAKIEEIGREGAALRESVGPRPQESDFAHLPDSQRFNAHTEAVIAWRRLGDEAARGHRAGEVEALRQRWKQQQRPDFVIVGRESEVTMNFFYAGCPQQAVNYVRAAVPELSRDSNGMLDPGRRLSFERAELTGGMNMRKTENGWRQM